MDATVSKRNNPEPVQWFVLNAIFGKEMQVRQSMSEKHFETFVPMRYAIRETPKGKTRILTPAIHNLIFVHATKSAIEDFKAHDPRTIYFMTRKEGNRRLILTVPDVQMEEFIRVARHAEEDLLYFRPDEIRLEKGDRVRVHGGKFDGLEGTLLKVKGKRSKRVVVKLNDLAAVAASYIEPDLIEVIDECGQGDLCKDTETLYESARTLLFDAPTDADTRNLRTHEVHRLSDRLTGVKGSSNYHEARLSSALLLAALVMGDNDRIQAAVTRSYAALQPLRPSGIKARLLLALYAANGDTTLLDEVNAIISEWPADGLSEKQKAIIRTLEQTRLINPKEN